MPALQLGTFTSEDQREVGVPKKALVPICCTDDDKMDLQENSFHLSPYQGNKFGSYNNQSKNNFGGTWPRSKVKGSFSLSSPWADSPSNREREVKSEERCIPKIPKTSVNGLGAVIEMQKDRDKMARRSPTSKDEFWEALWSHYDCLMDDGLIASCREANGELSWDDQEVSPDYTWSFTEFIEQFNQLHDWLHKLQSAVAGNEEQGDKGDSSVVEELQKVVYHCKLFNEQAQQLDKRYPDMKDEINRRVNLLNNKWEAAEQAVNPHKPQQTEDGIFQEVAYQMKCLRKWLRELESGLVPLIVCPTWTLQDLESKYKEQLVFQKEIESRGKYVSTLLKSCDRLVGCRVENTGPLLSWDTQRIRRVATNLERRWHTLWLKSLERQCLIEELLKKYRAGCFFGDSTFDLSFSEEPLTKYPRLSTDWDDTFISNNEDKINMMESQAVDQVDIEHQEQACESTPSMTQDIDKELEDDANTNNKGVMVGSSSIAELKAGHGSNIGRFEIIQDVGYSSESSAHLSNDERQEFIRVYSYSPVLSGPSLVSEYAIPSRIKESEVSNSSSNKLSSMPLPYLPPDKYPSIPFKHWQFAMGENPLQMSSAKRPLSTPNSTFYKMTSIDTENGDDGSLSITEEKYLDNNAGANNTLTAASSHNLSDQNLSDNAYQLTSSTLTAKTRDSELSTNDLTTSVAQVQPQPETESIHQLIAQAKVPSKDSVHQHFSKKSGRNAQVREWLQKHQMNKSADRSKEEHSLVSRMIPTVDSSCDASGEYTTNESDSEDSSSSADVNGSLAMTRSYTGSVETVIPAVAEDSKIQSDSHTESCVFPSIIMRGKRKNTRSRPWSVTEISNVSNGLRLSAHSTSEGALNMLCTSTVSQPNTDSSSSKWFIKAEKDTSCPSEGTCKISTSSSNSNNRQRRNHSRSSLHSCRYSGSGSDGISQNTTFCKSPYSDIPHYSTPTHRRKSGLLPSEKSSIQVSPVYRHRLSHPRSSTSGSNRKKSSQSSPESYQSAVSYQMNKKTNEDKHIAPQPPSSSVADSDQALTQTEDQSSVSDQVWDGYQDPPYFSEPYSEQALNEEELRKLIDFGDDYGAYIGFHSDASSLSGSCHLSTKSYLPHSQSFISTSATEVNADSDSDIEDLQHIFAQNMRNLQMAKNTLKRSSSQNEVPLSDYAELLATCQTHLGCLHIIADHLTSGDTTIGSNDFNCLTKLINEWESLKKEVGSKQKSNNDRQDSAEYLEIQQCLSSLSEKISGLSSSSCQSHATLDSLRERIATLQMSRSTLQQTKDSLLEVSKKIVRLMADADLLTCPLKEEFNQLYQKWEDTYEENGVRLTNMQEAYQKWHGCDELCQHLQKSIEECGTNQVDERQLTKVKAMLDEIKDFLGTGEPWQKLSERISSLQPSKGFSIPVPLPPRQLLSPVTKHGKTRLWRIIRVALPIQLALMLLYCIGCLLEPRCCDYSNTLNFSLSPQLRYVGGPPPV